MVDLTGRYVLKSTVDGKYLVVKTEYRGHNGNYTETFIWIDDLESADISTYSYFTDLMSQFPPGSVRIVQVYRREM